jgi:tetratricopeptide (TPR) repeat protein
MMPRTIYLSGKVMLDDGTPPPDRVIVERVCNGVARPEGYTDSKGRFSFQLGQNTSMMMDASVSSGNDPFNPGAGNIGGMGNQRGISERDLAGCELRANLAGFRSDTVMLAGRRSLDNPDVGTIVLHRLAKVEGYTFSATTALAPKDARKAYEKGLDQVKKQKLPDAEKELTKAVESYPKYAVAWYELGKVYQQENKIDDATRAYNESIKADSKFVSPYGQLARLAVATQKWDQAAQYTSSMLKLNPYVSPDIYFYSAVANYNIHKFDVAEEHAREAVKLDKDHRNPKSHHLLGVILAEKQDYKGAAEQMRIYLQFRPDAPDAAMVKQQLTQVEKAGGMEKPAQP